MLVKRTVIENEKIVSETIIERDFISFKDHLITLCERNDWDYEECTKTFSYYNTFYDITIIHEVVEL